MNAQTARSAPFVQRDAAFEKKKKGDPRAAFPFTIRSCS
jgi:hypothetical protein